MPARRYPVEASIRRPPWFMEYGSDLLGLERIKLMSLAERGLLATMRWHIWANDSLPADPKLIARLLGLEPAEVQAALTPAVMSFFAPMKSDSTRLICPELGAQMERFLAQREKQLQGTFNSHKARRKQGKETVGTHGGSHDGIHGGSGVASELNRTELNRTALLKGADRSQGFKTKSDGGAPDADFIADYEAEQAKENAGGAPASTRRMT